MKEKTNLEYISGFKFILDILVLLHHFTLLFYPGLVNGVDSNTNLSINIQKAITESPFNILGYGGALAVALFFIISGFLITYNFYKSNMNKDDIKNKLIKRLLQLFSLILISTIFAYIVSSIFNKLGFFTFDYLVNNSYYLNINYDPLNLFYEIFIGTFTKGIATFNPPLWTMSSELFGSLLIYVVLYFFNNSNKKIPIYLLLLMLFINSSLSYFIIGLILGELYVNKKEFFLKINIFQKILLFMVILIFSGYSYLNSSTEIYKYFGILFDTDLGIDSVTLVRYISSTLIFVLLLSSKTLKKLFSLKFINKLSKYSTEIYLFHWPILYTFILLIVSNIHIHLKYSISIFIGLILFIIVNFIVSFIYKKYFEKVIIKLQNSLLRWFSI